MTGPRLRRLRVWTTVPAGPRLAGGRHLAQRNVMPEATAWAGVLVTVAEAAGWPGRAHPSAVAGAWDPGSGRWLRLSAPPAGVQGLAFPDTGVWTGREFLFPGAAGLVALIPS